ncbi:MAG: ATP-binding protein [Actinomycetota bacterium]
MEERFVLQVDIDLPNELIAPAEARAALAGLHASLGDRVMADVLLLANELVTNSVRHSHQSSDGHVDVRAAIANDAVRVEVADGGPGFEWAGTLPAAGQPYGWGLHLVDRLASRWGTERGKRWMVWFEIDL